MKSTNSFAALGCGAWELMPRYERKQGQGDKGRKRQEKKGIREQNRKKWIGPRLGRRGKPRVISKRKDGKHRARKEAPSRRKERRENQDQTANQMVRRRERERDRRCRRYSQCD